MSRVCYAKTLRTTHYIPTSARYLTYRNVLSTQPGHLATQIYTTCIPTTIYRTRTCYNYRVTSYRTVPGAVITNHIPYTITVYGYATQITTHYTTSCTTVRANPPQPPPKPPTPTPPPPPPPPQTVTTTETASTTLTSLPDPSTVVVTDQPTDVPITEPVPQVTDSPSSESGRGVPIAPVVGGVVGGVVLAILLGFLIYRCCFKKAYGKAAQVENSGNGQISESDGSQSIPTLNSQGPWYASNQDGQMFQYANGQGQLMQQRNYAQMHGQGVEDAPQAGGYYAMHGRNGIEQNQNSFQVLQGHPGQAAHMSQIMGVLDTQAAAHGVVSGPPLVGGFPGAIPVAATTYADGTGGGVPYLLSQSPRPVVANDTGISLSGQIPGVMPVAAIAQGDGRGGGMLYPVVVTNATGIPLNGAFSGVMPVAAVAHTDADGRGGAMPYPLSQSPPPVAKTDTGTSSPKSSDKPQSQLSHQSSIPLTSQLHQEPPQDGSGGSPKLVFLHPLLYNSNQYRGLAEPLDDS